ncbi:MAG: ABC transporter permease [Clostridia bacterium]|nr:ABC transporter permease [Clostridia bacterium]
MFLIRKQATMRESAFLQRLYTTPLRSGDFILGYLLSLLPIAILQTAVCYLAAVPLGLTLSVRIVYSVLVTVPMAVFNISLGILCGSVLGSRQVGGICGALLTNLSAWMSGVWFDLQLVGSFFEKLAFCLPFVHAVRLSQTVLSGENASVFPHVLTVLLYALLVGCAAVICFLRQMKQQ